jgi:hypothetical protein
MIKDSLKLREFLEKHPNKWHSFSDDAKTNRALIRLLEKVDCLMIDWNTKQMFYRKVQS